MQTSQEDAARAGEVAVGRGVRMSVNTLSMRLILTRQPFAEYCNFPPGIPRGSAVKNQPAMQEMQEIWVQSLGWEDHLDREMAFYSLFSPGKSDGQWSLAGCSPWSHKVKYHSEYMQAPSIQLLLG